MPTRRVRLLISALAAVVALAGCTGDGDTSPGPHQSRPQVETPAPTTATTSPTPTTSAAPEEPEEPEPALDVTPAFFGMHDGRIAQGVLTDLPIGAVRLWDSDTSWRHVELGPGQFDWSPVDRAVATARSRGVRPMLVMGQTPAFHASDPAQPGAYGAGATTMPDMAAWRRYVRAAAQRYGNRTDYQVWNEANVVNYWSGTPREMAQLTVAASEEIRKVVPRATIVAPAFAYRLPLQQQFFREYWSQRVGGAPVAAAVDVVSLNLYPAAADPPEAQVRLLAHARRVLHRHGVDKPVWNTEINFGLLGGPTPPAIPVEEQRAYVMRTYLLNAGHGVERVYWYRWDLVPIANTLLAVGPDYQTPTLAGEGYATIHDWLAGTAVMGCGPADAAPRVVTCVAETPRGTQRHFYWRPSGKQTAVLTPPGTVSWTTADGETTRSSGALRLRVGQTPVMVTARRSP